MLIRHFRYFFRFFSLVILLLAISCSGENCIEANDFGENDLDMVKVISMNSKCEWQDDPLAIGTGDILIKQCIDGSDGDSNKYIITSSHTVTADSDTPGGCMIFKHCSSRDCSHDKIKITINDVDVEEEGQTPILKERGDTTERLPILAEAYRVCKDSCITSCLNNVAGNSIVYEPSWKKSKKKDGMTGIDLAPDRDVKIKVKGSLYLDKAEERNLQFSVKKHKLQDSESNFLDFAQNEALNFVLAGKWTDSNVSIGDNPPPTKLDREFKDPSIKKRIEFFRRGLIYLKPHPPEYEIVKNNDSDKIISVGVPIDHDFNKWYYNYDTEVYSSMYQISDFPKATDANTVVAAANAEYAVETDGSYSLGGPVILPENLDSIKNPFEGVVCVTETVLNSNPPDYYRVCGSGTYANGSFVRGEFANTEYGYLVDGNGTSSDQNNGSVTIPAKNFPYKIAFKILGDTTDAVAGSRACAMKITIGGVQLGSNISIKANKHWEVSDVISEKCTIDSILEGKEVIIQKTIKDTWTDSNNNTISCGQGMAIRILPLHEVKAEKSGFVSFKIIGDSKKFKYSNSDCNVGYQIINPTGAIDSDFYEYGTYKTGWDSVSDIPTNKVLATTKNGEWSKDEFFVRKGQVIRFNYDNWESYLEDTAYSEKEWDAHARDGDNNYIVNTSEKIQCGVGMVMKIEERPAVICKEGTLTGATSEEIPNPAYIADPSAAGTPNYKLMASIHCNAAGTKYCPKGCYNETDSLCHHSADDGDFTTNKCTACQTYIKENVPATTSVSLPQCYNLEDYTGKVGDLTIRVDKLPNGNFTDVGDIDYKKNDGTAGSSVEKYGLLTTKDYEKGARKLTSIAGSSIGNLENFELDQMFDNPDSYLNGNYYYTTQAVSAVSEDSRLKFLVIDNKDLTFNNDVIVDYTTNIEIGEAYKIKNSISRVRRDGENLQVILAKHDANLNVANLSTSTTGFLAWVVQYDSATGKLKTNSPYCFDKYGVLRKKSNAVDSGCPSTKSNIAEIDKIKSGLADDDDVRLFFKVFDNEVFDCDADADGTDDGIIVPDPKGGDPMCLNRYANNFGSYRINMQAKRDLDNDVSGTIVKDIMKPIIDVLDGKKVGIVNVIACPSGFDCYTSLGVECEFGDNDCFVGYSVGHEYREKINEGEDYCVIENVSCVDNATCYLKNAASTANICTDTTGDPCFLACSHIRMFEHRTGYLEKFYLNLISSTAYQQSLRVFLILYVTMFGFGFFFGLTSFTQGELLNRLMKVGIIYLFVGVDGWYFFERFFVQFFKNGIDYLVFAMASAFEGSGSASSSITDAFEKMNFHDKSVLFNNVDKNIMLMFSDQVQAKIGGLFFNSFAGWAYVFIIYSAIFSYIFTIANAMLIYLMAQVFISILLSFGPIFFILLLFDKTKAMFDKWISNLISFSLQQIFLLSVLGFFNILIYEIFKFVMAYRVCWAPIWVIRWPLLGSLELFNYWTVAGSYPGADPQAASASIPGLFHILLIYLVVFIMKQFITFMVELARGIGGGSIGATALASAVSSPVSDMYKKHIGCKVTDFKNKLQTRALNKVGIKTETQRKAADAQNDKDKDVRKSAVRAADRAAKTYKKNNLLELSKLGAEKGGAEKQNKKMDEVRQDAMRKHLSAKGYGGSRLDKMMNSKASDFDSSRSVLGIFGNAVKRRMPGTGSLKALKNVNDSKNANVVRKDDVKDAMKNMNADERKQVMEAVRDGGLQLKGSMSFRKGKTSFFETEKAQRRAAAELAKEGKTKPDLRSHPDDKDLYREELEERTRIILAEDNQGQEGSIRDMESLAETDAKIEFNEERKQQSTLMKAEGKSRIRNWLPWKKGSRKRAAEAMKEKNEERESFYTQKIQDVDDECNGDGAFLEKGPADVVRKEDLTTQKADLERKNAAMGRKYREKAEAGVHKISFAQTKQGKDEIGRGAGRVGGAIGDASKGAWKTIKQSKALRVAAIATAPVTFAVGAAGAALGAAGAVVASPFYGAYRLAKYIKNRGAKDGNDDGGEVAPAPAPAGSAVSTSAPAASVSTSAEAIPLTLNPAPRASGSGGSVGSVGSVVSTSTSTSASRSEESGESEGSEGSGGSEESGESGESGESAAAPAAAPVGAAPAAGNVNWVDE